MSQAMDLIDEACKSRDEARRQSAQWEYVAILLFLQRGDTGLRIPKENRDIGAYYIEPIEDDDGALSIDLKEGETNA